jgi:hypothetical protein
VSSDPLTLDDFFSDNLVHLDVSFRRPYPSDIRQYRTSSSKFNQNPYVNFVVEACVQKDVYGLLVGIHSRTPKHCKKRNKKVDFSLEQAMKVQRGSRRISLLFL